MVELKSTGQNKKKQKLGKEKELVQILQKLQAEFENYKKRTDKEKLEFMKFANAGVILKLLPILDNFELAMGNTENKDEFIKGIKMISQQFVKTLEDSGLKKIKAKGKEFDPFLHEALLQEESNQNNINNIVLEELQAGYMLGERVLRHVKVKISKKVNKK